MLISIFSLNIFVDFLQQQQQQQQQRRQRRHSHVVISNEMGTRRKRSWGENTCRGHPPLKRENRFI